MKKAALLLEPTLGIPVNPFLAKELIKRKKLREIIILSNDIEITDEAFERFRKGYKICGVDINPISCYINRAEVKQLWEKAKTDASKLMEILDSRGVELAQVKYKKTRIGLYLASVMLRNNPKLCIEWNPDRTIIINTLANWILSAQIFNTVAKGKVLAAESIALFSHSSYFWGFIGEYLAYCGIRSLVWGGPPIPEHRPVRYVENKNIAIYDETLPSVYVTSGTSQMNTIIQKPEEIARILEKSLYKRLDVSKLNSSTLNNYNALVERYSRPPYKVIRDSLDAKKFEDKIIKEKESPVFCLFLHSFNDSQFAWGYDGFNTLTEYYLEFVKTASLIYPKSKILVRPHPDIFLPAKSERIRNDIFIYNALIKKLFEVNNNNIYVLMPEIANSWFYELSEKAVAVTHHSPNVAIESLICRRLCFMSYSTLKVRIQSPHIVYNKHKKDLMESVNSIEITFEKLNKINRIDAEKACLIAGQYTRMDPSYDYKILVNNLKRPFSLLAGFDDVHKEMGPHIENEFNKSYANKDFDLEKLIEEHYGTNVLKAIKIEATRVSRMGQVNTNIQSLNEFY